MYAVLNLFNMLISFFSFSLIAYVVLSWLILFGVVNGRNPVIAAFNDFFFKMTEPLLRPFRRLQKRLMPTWQVDLSPILLIIALHFVRDLITVDLAKLLGY